MIAKLQLFEPETVVGIQRKENWVASSLFFEESNLECWGKRKVKVTENFVENTDFAYAATSRPGHMPRQLPARSSGIRSISKLLIFINPKNLRTIRKLVAYENFQDYKSVIPAKLWDSRPSPSFTKSFYGFECMNQNHLHAPSWRTVAATTGTYLFFTSPRKWNAFDRSNSCKIHQHNGQCALSKPSRMHLGTYVLHSEHRTARQKKFAMMAFRWSPSWSQTKTKQSSSWRKQMKESPPF